MNLGFNTVALKSTCKGCLSFNRKLTLVQDEEMKQLFIYLLESLDCNNQALLLCWECHAIIKRILVFKAQVKIAHKQLLHYVLNETSQLQSLSKLKQSELSLQEINYCNNTDISEKLDTVRTDTSDRRTRSSNKSATDVQTESVTFIKIEEDDEISSNDGGYTHSLPDRDLEVNDVENKTVFKEDPSQCEVQIENKKTKTKKARKKNRIEFDESDDEPLNFKKQKEESNECKPRGRRKKKEAGAKMDGRKHPAPTREKPPGVVSNARVNRKLEQLNVSDGQLQMVVLSWEEVEEERQKALNSVVFTRHDYRCYDCVVGFNHKFKWENHMKKHESSSGSVMCSVCRVRCKNAHALCAHRRRHRVRWRCVLCGAAWSRAAVAADHCAREHRAPQPTHTCPVCGHTAPTLGKLRNHIKNHAERQKCELCGKTFRDRTSLKTHLFIHKGEKEYACPRCDKRFLFKKAMEIHLVTHDQSAHLYCYQCDMNFKNRMSYYQHVKYNLKHIDPAKLKYACQLCDKKFVKATRLEEHNVAVHLKTTPIQCTMAGCNFACASRPVLRTHVRMVHRNLRSVRNHVCDTCGKAYTTRKILEGHMRSHTGERPFKCGQCPSTFGYEAALYNHNKLVHLKVKTVRRTNQASHPPGVPATVDPAVPPAGPSW